MGEVVSSTKIQADADEQGPVSGVVEEHLGKFRLVARLGTGGMGEALLAFATGAEGFRKLVVIKRLHARLSEDAKMRDLFLQEARLAARLNHPNVVQTYDVGVQDGTMFMSMEYLEGQPLSRLARAWPQPADPRIVASIISEALMGLEYAHELRDFDGQPLRLVHRDVSPHNLFVTYDGVVKVLDFGIAKAASQSSGTESGVLKGKIAYMSPEQLTQGEVDRRADIFCAGIVLWELLSGRRLLPKGSMQQTFYSLLNEAIPPPSSHTHGSPPPLDAIVLRALEKDPEKRYQTARAMRDDLEAYLAASGAPIRQEDIGRAVSEAFATERTDVQSRIRQMILKVDDDISSQSLPMLGMHGTHEGTGSSKSQLISVDVSDFATESSGLRRTVLIAALAATIAGALVAIALWSRKPASSAGPEPPRTSASGAPQQVASPLATTPVESLAAPGSTSAAPVPASAGPSPARAAMTAAAPARPSGTRAAAFDATAAQAPSATALAPQPSTVPPAPPSAQTESVPARRKFRTEL